MGTTDIPNGPVSDVPQAVMDAASDNEAKSILYLSLDGQKSAQGRFVGWEKAPTLWGKSSKNQNQRPDAFFGKKLYLELPALESG